MGRAAGRSERSRGGERDVERRSVGAWRSQ